MTALAWKRSGGATYFGGRAVPHLAAGSYTIEPLDGGRYALRYADLLVEVHESLEAAKADAALRAATNRRAP